MTKVYQNDADIGQDFFHMESLFPFVAQQQEVEREVDAKKHHKNRNDSLLKHCIIIKSIGPDRKTTGSGGTHGQTERTKQRHAS